jgi:hypothetical protein
MNFSRQSLFFIFLGWVTFTTSLDALALTQPDWNKTPGLLCSPQDPNFSGYDYPEHIARCNRNVGTQEKQQIAQEYGNIPEAQWANYEFDHLIPLCVGGSDDVRNLWPQPINDAHQKDILENNICLAMKAGTMTQAQAVQKVHDWFASHAQAQVLLEEQ